MLQQRFSNLRDVNIERDLANGIVSEEILNTLANIYGEFMFDALKCNIIIKK